VPVRELDVAVHERERRELRVDLRDPAARSLCVDDDELALRADHPPHLFERRAVDRPVRAERDHDDVPEGAGVELSLDDRRGGAHPARHGRVDRDSREGLLEGRGGGEHRGVADRGDLVAGGAHPARDGCRAVVLGRRRRGRIVLRLLDGLLARLDPHLGFAASGVGGEGDDAREPEPRGDDQPDDRGDGAAAARGGVEHRARDAAEPEAADGLLDEAVGDHRGDEREREGDPAEGPRRCALARPGGECAAEEHEDGPVPQVDAVAALADPAQRREVERARDGGARHEERRDEHGGEHGDEGEAAAIGRVEFPGHEHRERDEAEKGERAERDDRPAMDAAGDAARLRAVGEHGEEGADREAEGVGVGAVVHARRVDGGVGDAHPRRRRDREDADERQARPAREAHEQHDDEERPDDVELLLDRERPEVAEHLGHRLVEVGGSAGDEEPVAREGEGPDDLGAEADERVAADRERRRAGDEQEQGERGQQSSCASRPEPAERDASGRGAFPEEQGRDEEPAHDEEDVDAEVTPDEGSRDEVEDDDRRHRERAHPVEPGDAETRRSRRARRRGRC
jgi:AAA ATPase containing von Willebrand factor type A (vWA) domain